MAKARQKSKAKPSNSKNRLTESQIAVHWKEEQYLRPSKKFIAQANLADPAGANWIKYFVRVIEEMHVELWDVCVHRHNVVGQIAVYGR